MIHTKMDTKKINKKTRLNFKPQAKLNPEFNITLVLDESGSMSGWQGTLMPQLKNYISNLAKEVGNKKVSVNIYTFSGSVRKVAQLQDLGSSDGTLDFSYSPGGTTSLYDAITTAVNKESEIKAKNQLVIVMSDGGENTSTFSNKTSVSQLIETKQEKEWTFVFIGADMDAYGEAGAVGFSHANIVSHSKGNYDGMFVGLMTSNTSYLNNPRAGKADFFAGTKAQIEETVQGNGNP